MGNKIMKNCNDDEEERKYAISLKPNEPSFDYGKLKLNKIYRKFHFKNIAEFECYRTQNRVHLIRV